MCENLLKSVLIGDIKTETIIKWLKNEDLKDENDEDILSYDCSQGEFILFFLNYLHESTAGVLQTYSTQMTPNRIKTPRRVESISSKSNKNNDSKKTNSRRAALFPEKQKNPSNQCLGVSTLDNDSLNVSRHTTSTPRPNKSRTSLDRSFPNPFENPLHSCMSPISPISNNHNRSINTEKNKSLTPKTSSRSGSSNFCLGDFIVKKSSNKQKKTKLQNISKDSDNSFNKSNDNLLIENCRNISNIEKSFESNTSKSISLISVKSTNKSSRRINPTNLTTLSQEGSLNSKRITPNNVNNSFSFQKLPETDVSTENSRDILREERLKIISRSKPTEINTPVRASRSTSICIIQPELESVTNKTQLEILAEIYSLLIDLNLVLNTLSELYFLITLILIHVDKYKNNTKEIEELRRTLKNSLTDLTDDVFYNIDGLFNNVHNCVYFAANVLSKQFHLLSALDRASLKLLQENTRLQIFAPDLTKQLVVYHGKKLEKKTEIYSPSGGENVSFISDTDNRENFPNDTSFHTFRRQRDMFYEFLRTWERSHMQSDWNFNSVLTTKIRNLISLHYEPVNYMHLARLFKNQLLAECSQEVDAALLPSCLNAFSNINAEKLSRLTNRLVSKKSTGGPSPEPSFPGKQEFYKEFIIVCESPKFHKHLIDCLVAEILLLDDTTLWPLDADETNSSVDLTIKKFYLNSLKSLKILAKFLGLLESYPYKSDKIPTHQILTTQISIRKHFIPTINIIQNFNEALLKGTLILTIPWVADYLAMLDHTTLRLPYFTQFIETLFEIHYNSKQYTKNFEQILMIKLCLGWLFERPNFPLESYQTWITKKYQQNTLNEIVPLSNNIPNSCNSLNLDSIDFVDETILFSCCPYIIEIRNFLSSDPNSYYNNSGPVKYIRPISTVGENSDITKKRLQKQLEDAFFHNQPSSTRKILDLIIDRVSSACVKYICHNLVPDAKQKYLNVFLNHLEHISTLNLTEIKDQISNCCLKQAREYSEKCFQEFKLFSTEEINRNTRLRCENSLKGLLSDDVDPIARATCASIAIEHSNQKIQQWYSGHVNPGIFLKEFVSEMENMKHNAGQNSKKITYKLPSKGRSIDHNPDASSPVVILINIREQMYKIHEKPDEVELDDLIKTVEETSITCQKRCDLNQVAQFTSCRLFFDMFFMLASKRPDIATDTNLIECFVQFWSKYLHKSEKDNFFERVFCPRNAGMFENSSDPKSTWLSCEKLLIELFNKQLLKTNQFEKQTIAMFRYEWESNTIKHFSQCLQNVVDDYVSKNGAQENFTFILSWIAEYCNDDEFF